MNYTVSAIVPAYNEEMRIRQVLDMLSRSKYLDEIICVNDGSSDRTGEIAEAFAKIRLINLAHNGGKANAIAEGVLAAKGDLVLFIDADLEGLTDETIQQLIDPIRKDGYEAVVALPTRLHDVTFFRPLTGERCYLRQDLLPHIEELRSKGYGLELALNYLYSHKKVKIFRMSGVTQLHKIKKYAPHTAIGREIHTWRQILGEVVAHKRPAHFAYHAYVKNYYVKPKHR